MRAGERTLRLLVEPIAAFLADPATTDIVVQRPGEVGVEAAGVWSWHHCPELTFGRLDGIATLCAAMSQQDVGPDRPLCASVLPGGERVQVCRPPVVQAGTVSLTIRRPPAFVPTVDGLFGEGPAAPRATTDDAEVRYFHTMRDWRRFFPAAVRRGRRSSSPATPDPGRRPSPRRSAAKSR
jgi:type IV secretion system protein VirB11